MSHFKSLCFVALCATGMAGLLEAQQNRLFVLPGSTSTVGSATLYIADNLSYLQNVNVPPGAYQALARPDGSRFYIVSTSPTAPVTAVDALGYNALVLGTGANLGASAAALSPDGRRLIIGVGSTVYVFDTTSVPEQSLTSGGVTVAPADWRVVDIAVAQDSSRAFVLLASNSGSRLVAIDLSTNSAAGSVDVQGIANGVAVGPNTLVYVSTPNLILEYDGRAANPTLRSNGSFSLNGNPGKPVFTPSGRYLVAVNLQPAYGQALAFAVDLANASRVVSSLSSAAAGTSVSFSALLPNGNNRFLAFSSGAGMIFDLTINPGTVGLFGLATLSFPSVPSTGITSVALSNELAITSRNSAASLYFLTNTNTLYQIDLAAQTQKGMQAGFNAGSVVSYAGVPPTTTAPAYTLQIGDQQSVAVGGSFLPLVVRVYDSNGKPLFNVPVTWTVSGGALASTSSKTTAEGYASAQVASPTASGTITVTATPNGGTPVSFTLAAGTGGGGGTGNIGSSVSIVKGNGQMVAALSLAQTPFTVVVKDSNGNPQSNIQVTWNITNGAGTLQTSTSTCSSTTDSNGLACVQFLATAVPFGLSVQESTINAAIPSGASVNFVITAYITQTQQGGPGNTPTVLLLEPTLANNLLITGKAGALLKGAIQAQVAITSGSQAGQPLPDIGIRLVNAADPTAAPAGTCDGGTPLSDSTGLVTCDVRVGGTLGPSQVTVLVGDAIAYNVNFIVTVGDPANVKIQQGNNQSGNPGQLLSLALRAQVTDLYGNALKGVAVTWQVTSGSATLSNSITTTDVSGMVSTLVKLGATGDSTIKLTAGSATATFTVHTNVIIGGVSVVSGDQQTAIVGQAFAQPLVVRLTDANNNPLPALPVSFTVASGSATLSASSVNSDANGLAQVSVTAGSTAGTIVITANGGSGGSATFTLTARLAGPVVAASGFFNSASGQPGVTPCGLASVIGSGMVPQVTGAVYANQVYGPWPTTFQGVSISFGGVLAPIYSVSNYAGKEQINFQTPCELTPGSVNVTVSVANGSPTTVSGVPVLAYSLGLFEWTTSDNTKLGVLLKQDGSFATPQNPVVRGEVVRMIATGLGQTTPATATNRTGVNGQNVAATLIVGVNNAGVDVLSATYMPEMLGLYVVAFTVPPDVPSGLRPLVLAVNLGGSLIFSNGSLIPIQ